MIITCEQCTTRFQLDDAKVPDGGVRVRCSRCKHSFTVKPAPAAPDVVERAVDRALAETESDEARSDGLPGDTPASRAGGDESPFDAPLDELLGDGDLGAAFDEPDDPTPARGEARGTRWGEEEDWEFSEDPIQADFATELPPESEPSADGDADLLAAREAVDGLLGDEDAPAEAPAEVDRELDAFFSLDLGEEEIAEEPPGAIASEAGAGTDGGGELEPDSDEDWGFSAEPSPPRADTGVAPPPQAVLPSATGVPWKPASRARRRAPSVGPWLGRGLHTAGWTALVALLAALLHGTLRPETPVPPSAADTLRAGAFELDPLQTARLETRSGQDLWVVRTRARLPEASIPGSRLSVRLLAADGRVISADAASLAPPLSETLLREEGPGVLAARQESAARALAWELWTPQPMPLQALLPHLPDGVARIDLAVHPVAAPVVEAPPVPRRGGADPGESEAPPPV